MAVTAAEGYQKADYHACQHSNRGDSGVTVSDSLGNKLTEGNVQHGPCREAEHNGECYGGKGTNSIADNTADNCGDAAQRGDG